LNPRSLGQEHLADPKGGIHAIPPYVITVVVGRHPGASKIPTEHRLVNRPAAGNHWPPNQGKQFATESVIEVVLRFARIEYMGLPWKGDPHSPSDIERIREIEQKYLIDDQSEAARNLLKHWRVRCQKG
jgi:hypothetical protein